MLSVAKILENMEIGHNVLHGQWDWMRDPEIHSTTWEWDNATPAADWKNSPQQPAPHLDQHRRQGPRRGLRRDADVAGRAVAPAHLLQLPMTAVLSLLFQYGIAIYDAELERVWRREKPVASAARHLRGVWRKVRPQVARDYLLWPLMTGVNAPATLARERDRERRAQRLVAHDHLLRALPGRRRAVHRGAGRGRVPRRVVPAPAARLGEPRRRPAVPPDEREPVVPDRAPPVPRPAEQPLRRDRSAGPRAVRALRPAVRRPGRSAGSTARCCARSPGCRCRRRCARRSTRWPPRPEPGSRPRPGSRPSRVRPRARCSPAASPWRRRRRSPRRPTAGPARHRGSGPAPTPRR